MREMKDSGIEWIGEIPEIWSLKPIRALFDEVTEKNFLGTCSNALKFTYGSIVRKPNFDADADDYVASTILNYTVVEPGTIMLNGLNLNFDFVSQRIGLVKEKGVITSAYMAFKPNEKQLIDSEFATYLFKAYDGCKAFHNMGGGVRKILNFNEFKKYYIPLPDLNEQQHIVDFLDTQCSEIDATAEDIQKEISLLEDYKKSVITEAVTKGLNPDAEMKDSGIEWIGEIPKEWKINKIKYMFSNGKGLPITKENLIDKGLPVISYGQIHSKINNGTDIGKNLLRFVSENYSIKYPQCSISENDFVFADTSEDYDGCGNCVFKRDNSKVFAGYHTIILHSLLKRDNRFLAYLFKTDIWRKQIREKASGVKVFSITQKTLMNCKVILPEYSEEKIIADYLDTKCSEIDSLIADKKRQLDILADYKKSIIYEYVTGKKEVI